MRAQNFDASFLFAIVRGSTVGNSKRWLETAPYLDDAVMMAMVVELSLKIQA